jgi:hypothetical protein
LAGVIVTNGLSLRNVFSAMPLTFIKSSIGFQTMIGPMFMLVNLKCAHHVRPLAVSLDHHHYDGGILLGGQPWS